MTWVIEQGAVGGVPLLDFQFGCASNAEAIVPSPYQFTYFQGGGFDAVAAVLPADRPRRLRQRLEARRATACDGRRRRLRRHHGAGEEDRLLGLLHGRRRRSQSRTADARIRREGKVKKLVEAVEQISFSGRRAVAQGQDDHLCHRALRDEAGPAAADRLTEIAPGVDLERDVLAQSEFPLLVSAAAQNDGRRLFHPEPIGLQLQSGKEARA